MNWLASAALRIPTGAFILNSGIGKIGMPAEASEGLQEFAATGIPAVKKLPKEQFGNILGWAETGIGAAVLAPFIPNILAGTALAAFGGGLLTLYFADPDNREEDGIRPSDQGLPLAKDSWLAAIGLALLAADLGSTKDERKAKKQAKKVKKAAEKAAKKAGIELNF